VPSSLPSYPALYQINPRVWLREAADKLGRPATLDDIKDGDVDRIAALGFDWLWLLGIWQTGEAGRRVSMTNQEWLRAFRELLPDLEDRDICGSCFAITGYTVHTALGGESALKRLRERLAARGIRLMLDFIPNHMALDHPWVSTRPELFVQGSPDDLVRLPGNYRQLDTPNGPKIFAYGRDPYFPGWPDTLQLDYSNPATQLAMRRELSRVAERCDGVRCDMAMLILPDVFQRTWGATMEPFWPDAIRQVKERNPEFCFMAEVYWDLEWTLQQQGFDFTYDKRLYDRLAAHAAGPVRDHLRAGLDFQRKLARFLENHDEPRAAQTFSFAVHQAAAIIAFLTPGLRFLHQGQFEGRIKRVPVHLCRAPAEPVNVELQAFYQRLITVLQLATVREGEWRLLGCVEAWSGNATDKDFVAFTWEGQRQDRLLVVVNFASHQGQCYVRLPWPDLTGMNVRLADRMGPARYERAGADLIGHGLYLDLRAWGYHVFDVTTNTP
jgi:glycosidase